ncbi:hypothetical protein HDU98_002131 [Podochytrium sp. JEL0797]|nr:hypothetical protein HDU98_002131 [Podochytrium sp. JEL0797]
MGLQRRASATGSQTSSRLTAALRFKPRLYMLISGFIAVCSVTIGVLGWRLTLNAGSSNVNSLMEQIESLVSNLVQSYIVDTSATLTSITKIQARMFKWQQVNMTVYTYPCLPDGEILWGSNAAAWDFPGNGSLANPGNNNTLQNAVGGTAGTNLEYALGPVSGNTVPFLYDNNLIKTSYAFSINDVTGEQVVFGNDWSLVKISEQIVAICEIVSFPVFAGVVKVNTGTVLATSSSAPLFSIAAQTLFAINEIQDPFFADFSNFVNSTIVLGLINDLPNQLDIIYTYVRTHYPGSENTFEDRVVDGVPWKLALKAFSMSGSAYLILVYMNVATVEAQLGKQSTTTGYVISGIIVAVVVTGFLFSILIGRQLSVVSRQIQLLKDMKFKEVLGGGTDVKDRSFIYELAELQKCFYQMVVKFGDLLQINSSAQVMSHIQSHTGAPSLLRPSVVMGRNSDTIRGPSTVGRESSKQLEVIRGGNSPKLEKEGRFDHKSLS